MSEKILVIYTGGTIGMVPGEKGYEPKKGYLKTLLAERIPELKARELPSFDVLEYSPLLDSSNMTPWDWFKIAKDIYEHYSSYQGFVVLHGTDTMAYTASAVAFLLQGLGKPVIFTGSQIPLIETRNDARENLIASFLLAREKDLKEVVICFGNKLLRGVRASKVDADSFAAFASPNFPPLGEVGIELKINKELLLPPLREECKLRVKQITIPNLLIFPLFPGFSGETLEQLIATQDVQMVVLETFGSGNAPEDNKAFLRALEKGREKGILFFNRTQCLKGKVRPQAYATGQVLTHLGVLPAWDMTREALVSKLICAYSEKGLSFVPRALNSNWCGEVTF